MTRYLTFLAVFYILHVTVSGRAESSDQSGGRGGINLSGSWDGSNTGFSLGSSGNIGGGQLGKLFGSTGGGSEGSAGGGGGGSSGSGGGGSVESNNNGGVGGSGSISVSSNIDLKSVITDIIESPAKFIRAAIRLVANFAWKIVTLQIKVLKIPYSAISKVVNVIKTVVVDVVSRVMNVILKVQSINAEAVSKVIGVVKSIVGSIVSTLASVQISGIQAAFGILGFSRDRVVGIVSVMFKTVKNIITALLKVLNGGVKALRLDEITQLPVIRNIVGIISSGYSMGLSVVYKQLIELSHFVDKILYDHQDFFIPIFHRVLNIVLAIRDALTRILDNGEHSGIKAMMGNLKIVLAPLEEGGWQWTGLDGQTYHGSLTLNAICKKFGATVLPGSVYPYDGGCSGGPTEGT